MRKVNLAVGISCIFAAACSGGRSDQKQEEPAPVEAIATEPAFDPAEAMLEISAKPVDASKVEISVSTNIPLPVEMMAGVWLADQADEDVAIGNNRRVTLEKPEQTFVVDAFREGRPVPSGEYVAEVGFYKRWGAKDGNPEAAGVNDIEAEARVRLAGLGMTRAQGTRQVELQRWVMGNVAANDPWDQARFEAKLGRAVKGPSTLSHLHDAYYFPEADMTFLVNRLRREVSIWRLGNVQT